MKSLALGMKLARISHGTTHHSDEGDGDVGHEPKMLCSGGSQYYVLDPCFRWAFHPEQNEVV